MAEVLLTMSWLFPIKLQILKYFIQVSGGCDSEFSVGPLLAQLVQMSKFSSEVFQLAKSYLSIVLFSFPFLVKCIPFICNFWAVCRQI